MKLEDCMIEFYFGMIVFWGAWALCSILSLIGTRNELRLVLKRRAGLILIIFGYSVIYTVVSSCFPSTKPLLTESTLDELEFTEGYCYVQRYARRSYINVGSNRLDFDVSLWLSSNKSRIEKKIDRKYIKLWHRGQMVYQISKDGEIIFSIDDANKNIEKYNFWVAPLDDFIVIACSMILELLIVQVLVFKKEKL